MKQPPQHCAELCLDGASTVLTLKRPVPEGQRSRPLLKLKNKRKHPSGAREMAQQAKVLATCRSNLDNVSLILEPK